MVGQFELCLGECFVKGLWIVEEVVGDFFKFWVEVQGQVGDQYGWFVFFFWVKWIWDNFWCVFGFELDCVSWVVGLYLFVFEQVFEKVIVLLGGCLCLDYFQIGGDGVCVCVVVVVGVLVQILCFQWCGFWFGVDVVGFCGVVGFVQCMVVGDQCDDFFIVYCYIVEGGVNGCCGGQWFVVGVWIFWVDINQIYFGGVDGLFCQVFWMMVGQLFFFIVLVDVEIWFLDVFVIGVKVKGVEVGVFQSDVICQYVKVGSGDFLVIFLFYWLQQMVGFIEVDVVRSGVQGGKVLLFMICVVVIVNGVVGVGVVSGYMNK